MARKQFSKSAILFISLFSAFWVYTAVELYNNKVNSQLEVFVGDWKNDSTLESWSQLNDKTFEGFMFVGDQEDTIYYESLKITKMKDDYFYFAYTPQHPMPIPFKLDMNQHLIDNQIFNFKNPNHDFPKFIKYQFNKDSLYVIIGDSSKTVKFEFKKY